MGHVTVSVNIKSLSRECTVFIKKPWVVLPSVIPDMFSVYVKSRRAAVLKAKEKL